MMQVTGITTTIVRVRARGRRDRIGERDGMTGVTTTATLTASGRTTRQRPRHNTGMQRAEFAKCAVPGPPETDSGKLWGRWLSKRLRPTEVKRFFLFFLRWPA